MLIVKTPPIMAACPRGGFTRGSPWRRASPFLFLPTGPARAEFLFLRPPLKRRRIERHSHPPSPISLSLSLSLSSSSLILHFLPPSFIYPTSLHSLFLHPPLYFSFHSFIYSFRISPNLSTFVSVFLFSRNGGKIRRGGDHQDKCCCSGLISHCETRKNSG